MNPEVDVGGVAPLRPVFRPRPVARVESVSELWFRRKRYHARTMLQLMELERARELRLWQALRVSMDAPGSPERWAVAKWVFETT